MKRLCLLAFTALTSVHLFAQNLSFSPSIAGRGDRVRFTIEGNSGDFSVQSVSVGLTIITPNGSWGLIADSAVIINDSVIKGAIDIPRYLADGPYTIDVSLINPFQYFGIDSGITISGGVTKPEIISMTPSQGGRGDSIDFTIFTTGTYFTQLDSTNISIFIQDSTSPSNYINVMPVTIVNDSQLQGAFRIPRYFKNGPLQLSVYTPDDNTMTKSGGFSINGGANLPYLESISQNTGGRGDSLSFFMHFKHTIFETTFQENGWNYVNFWDTSGHYFGSYDIDLIDDTTLSVKLVVPKYYADGAFNVGISVAEEGFMFISDGFSIIGGAAIPQIVSATPNQGQRGTYINFEIHSTGTRFDMIDPNAFSLSFAEQWFQFYPVSYEIIDSITITGKLLIGKNFPNGTMLDVVINNPLDGNMVLENALEINGGKSNPRLLVATPPVLNRGNVVDTYITGISTDFDKDSIWVVNISGFLDVIEYEVIDSNTIRVRVDVPQGASSGFYGLTIYTDLDGWLELPQAFWITPIGDDKAIVSFDPPVLIKNTTVDLTITTAGTQLLDGLSEVFFYTAAGETPPIKLNHFEIISNTEILCNVTIDALTSYSFCRVAVFNSITGYLNHVAGIRMINTSVKETAEGIENVPVYPNPSSGNVYFKPKSSDPVEFVVMNSMGQVVLEGAGTKQADGTSLLFNRSECGIPGGVYFIRLSQNNETGYSRILLE
jgi:hypothetical protein